MIIADYTITTCILILGMACWGKYMSNRMSALEDDIKSIVESGNKALSELRKQLDNNKQNLN